MSYLSPFLNSFIDETKNPKGTPISSVSLPEEINAMAERSCLAITSLLLVLVCSVLLFPTLGSKNTAITIVLSWETTVRHICAAKKKRHGSCVQSQKGPPWVTEQQCQQRPVTGGGAAGQEAEWTSGDCAWADRETIWSIKYSQGSRPCKQLNSLSKLGNYWRLWSRDLITLILT